MTKVWQVQVAAPSEEAAQTLARTAVEARLAEDASSRQLTATATDGSD
jgi:hypothetical protein